jgi:LysR family glycine cleavage system transcriptional activator
LSDAYAEAQGATQSVLRITTLLTFASHWLAKRLGGFQIAHPGIAVRLDTSDQMLDFSRDEVDVAIRSGNGEWPGLAMHFLMATDFTPMLSPKLAASIGGVNEPADLLRLPILGPNDPWWGEWFALAGVASDGLASLPDIRLGSQAHEASAALAGQGVAVLSRAFFTSELAEGRLLQPFDLVCRSGHSYWLAYRQERRNAPKIRAFREWLLTEMQRLDEPAG